MQVAVSTWSQDVQRGLDHPVSVAARQARIAAQQFADQDRTAKFNLALHLLRETLRDETQLVTLLHVVGSTLSEPKLIDTDLLRDVELIDELADSIQFRG